MTNVVTGIFYNTIYISLANKKIEKLKHTSGSKDEANIINVCSEKGGVNKKAALFCIVLQIAIVLCAVFVFPDNKYVSKTTNFFNSNYENIKSKINNK